MATTQREAERRLREATAALSAQPRARQELIKAFSATALRSAIDESEAAESVDDLREWTEVFGALLALDRDSRGRVTDLLVDELEEAARRSDDEPDARTLEQWGRLQVLATYERVREQSHTVAWLEDHGVSRQRLNQWRRAGRLWGIADVPGVKGYAYPRWQFTDTLRPQPWLPPVLAAAAEARLDGLGLHLFMTNPEAGDGRSPLEAAEAGDVATTVKLVAAANALGG
jgi:hypothetical protein